MRTWSESGVLPGGEPDVQVVDGERVQLLVALAQRQVEIGPIDRQGRRRSLEFRAHAKVTAVGSQRGSGRVWQPNLFQVTPPGRQHVQDAAGHANTVLDHLNAVRAVFGEDLEDELRLPVSPIRSDCETDGRVVHVDVLRRATHGLSDGGRVPHSHRQGTEDADVLAIGQAETEVGAGQVMG